MRLPAAGGFGKALVVALCIGYPLALHFLYSARWPVAARLVFSLIPVATLIVLLGAQRGRQRGMLLALAVAAAVIVALDFLTEDLGVAAAGGLPHFAAYSALLVFFGRTLLPGREPLVTGLARAVHGDLPPRLETYTRQVTLAWCVFCGLQLCLSIALLCFAPLAAWSLFVNVLNLPLVGAMFAGEYIYRILRFSDYPHASLRTSAQAFSAYMTRNRATDKI